MEFKRIRYKISDQYNESGFKLVSGYAVHIPHYPVRFCVRYIGEGLYKADHFDTGMALGSYANNKEDCVLIAVEKTNEALLNGKYLAGIQKANEWYEAKQLQQQAEK